MYNHEILKYQGRIMAIETFSNYIHVGKSINKKSFGPQLMHFINDEKLGLLSEGSFAVSKWV